MHIELKNLSKLYGVEGSQLAVLENLSYKFPERGSIAILGRSGVGKSTLLHILGGLDYPSTGEVTVAGTELSSLNDEELSRFRGVNIGFVFQFHHLLPDFTALENVAMPLLISDLPEDEANERARAALAELGLAERATHLPGELSGGEQQRVAIARALVASPKLILADEPTGNLDEKTAALVHDKLLESCSQQNTVLIVVTHNRLLAEQMDLVLEMGPGGALINAS